MLVKNGRLSFGTNARVGSIPSYSLPTDGREITCDDGWRLSVDAVVGPCRESEGRDKGRCVRLRCRVPSSESLGRVNLTITRCPGSNCLLLFIFWNAK